MPQRSWPTRALDNSKLHLTASPSVSARGARHRGQAYLISWDARALTCTSHLRSRPTWYEKSGKQPKETTAVMTTHGNGTRLWQATRPCVNNKKGCKPTTVMAKYGARRRQAVRPCLEIIIIRKKATTVVATHGTRRRQAEKPYWIINLIKEASQL